MICTILTDNRNRTASDLRFIFTKNGGSLGTPGSVAWQFDRKGVIVVEGEGVDEDALMDVALSGGAEDIAEDGDQWQITTEPHDFMPVRQALEEAGIPYVSADLTMLPKTTVEPSEKRGAPDPAADRPARGERRRPGRLRQLRHLRGDPRGGRVVARGGRPGSLLG